MSSNELMVLSDLTVRYPIRLAIHKVSLNIEQNRSYALLGPSGCGKTTLLLAMVGLLPESAEVEGERRERDSIRKSLMIQDFGLFPWKTVYKNILLPLELKKGVDFEAKNRAMELMEKLKLTDHMDDYPGTLSGGQKQRVALARTWLSSPDLLLMDEPLSSLDAITREQLQDEILNMFNQTNMTMITVTHSIEEAVYLAEKIIVMKENGTISQVVENRSFGTEQVREKQIFFDECLRVRRLMNGEAL